VTNNDTLGDPERVEHTDYVSDEALLSVLFDWSRGVGFTVATLIRSDGVKSCVDERADLMPP
jgi:hypothetical protein